MRLVVQTYGTRLSLDNGMVVVETDAAKEEISLLHLTSIHIQTNARISSALIEACIRSQIPVFLETDLHITAMIWAARYGSFARIRRKQALFSYARLKYELIKRILLNKNRQRLAWLKRHTRRPGLQELMDRIEQINRQIAQAPPDDQSLRTLEAHSSKRYFEILKHILPAPFRFEKRTHRQSRDPFNVLLNYTYGMLYNEITKAAIFAGLDPDLGFFHAPQYNRPALSFDLIENYRPWGEQWLYELVKSSDFAAHRPCIDDEGRILPPAKKALITHMTVRLEQTRMRYKNRVRTPVTHIQLDTQQLASYLLGFTDRQLLENIQPPSHE